MENPALEKLIILTDKLKAQISIGSFDRLPIRVRRQQIREIEKQLDRLVCQPLLHLPVSKSWAPPAATMPEHPSESALTQCPLLIRCLLYLRRRSPMPLDG